MKYLINNLYLVYPPITNQEGDWLMTDMEVREFVKSSRLYMIVHREELKFLNYEIIFKEFGIIRFQLKLGKIVSPFINISIKKAMNFLIENECEVDIELGDKLFRAVESNNPESVIMWLTPDKFLFDYWRNSIQVDIEGTLNHRNFTKYELYYVGISKKNDSFSRLFETAHHGRLKILTNEYPKAKESRLTDELLILLFDIDKMNINVFDESSEIEEIIERLNYNTQDDRIIADAEKAFVRLLCAKYNEVKFDNYPFGTDGLYHEGLGRYAYGITEDISIYTSSAVFNGAVNTSEKQDCILVDNEKAVLIKGF